MRKLDDATYVSGQLDPDDVPALTAAGIRMIVNNRPDGEEPHQPSGARIEEAAKAAGIAYRHVPMSAGLSAELIEAMAGALDEAEGPMLAFCRSGTRSTYLWALARSARGVGAEELEAGAADAGYDLSPIRRFL